MEQLVSQLLQKLNLAGYYFNKLNKLFYFHLDINTYISIPILLLMWLLYIYLQKLTEDKILDGVDLLKLLAFYFVSLAITVASYADLNDILQDLRTTGNFDSAFIVITLACLIIVIAIVKLGASTQTSKHKRRILIAFYIPFILLLLTNGRILHKSLDSLKSILPRSEAIAGMPSEYANMKIGGIVDPQTVKRMESLINQMRYVKQCAIIGHMDEKDGFVKPKALVVRRTGTVTPEWSKNMTKQEKQRYQAAINELTKRIKDYANQRFRENPDISDFLFIKWVEIIPEKQLRRGPDGAVLNEVMQKERQNWSDLFKAKR